MTKQKTLATNRKTLLVLPGNGNPYMFKQSSYKYKHLRFDAPLGHQLPHGRGVT